MAKVQDPSGSGLLPGGVVIDPNGNVYHHHKPRDARTPEQLRYRQAMRGLYNVLPNFGDSLDAAIRTALGTSSWWSSQTFAQWAANHLDAIAQDLNNYGRTQGFGHNEVADDFNRPDAPTPGDNWTKIYFVGYPPNDQLTNFPIRSNRLRLPNNTIGMYLWNAPTAQDVDIWATAYGHVDRLGFAYQPFWTRLTICGTDAIYPLYSIDVDYNKTISLIRVTVDGPTYLEYSGFLYGPEISYRIGGSIHQGRITIYASTLTGEWTQVIAYDDPEPLTGNRAGISLSPGWNPADDGYYTEFDDFGLIAPFSQATRDQWNLAARSIGIGDLAEPVPPFNYGEAGELLFLTCARLWHIAPTGAEMDPTGTDPQDWLTYLATGSFPP